MTDPFKKPSETDSGGVRFGDFVDETLLIQPTKYEDGLTGKFTKPGETFDRVTADVTVIDLRNPAKSEKHTGMWITQGRIIGKVKGEIDGMVLGKLIRPKATSSEPNPAYDLEDPSEAEIDAARKYLAGAEDEPPF